MNFKKINPEYDFSMGIYRNREPKNSDDIYFDKQTLKEKF